MRKLVTVVGMTALATATVGLTGCSSGDSTSAEGTTEASAAATAASASPRPTPSGNCTLAPDTKLTDMTFEEVNELQLNNGEPVPTLAEFLDYANEAGVGVLPEIKTFAPAEGQPKPEPSEAQLQLFSDMIKERSDISEVLVGSFDESTLKYFADNEPDWARIWFRGVGGTNADPLEPPTVAEMQTKAPSADALGLLNILYVQGTFAPTGQTYDVPQEFANADIPVYIWYNTASGGDSAEDGAPLGGTIPSPGWNSIAALQPANVKWIATDFTKEYDQWAETVTDAPQMVAHRGGGEAGVSENSMAAFKDAVANGASVLETDVQWTKPTENDPDGVAVLMHDDTVNRTATCPGG
jgi:glycerophosphoryl diester phosphodiesterase